MARLFLETASALILCTILGLDAARISQNLELEDSPSDLHTKGKEAEAGGDADGEPWMRTLEELASGALEVLANATSEESAPTVPPSMQRIIEINARCTWTKSHGRCREEGCRFRPLPGDKGLSESCRFIEDWVIGQPAESEPRKSLTELYPKALAEVSETFKTQCAGEELSRASRKFWTCARMSGEMLQATAFLIKVDASAGQISQSDAKQIDVTTKNLAWNFGDDGKYVVMLTNKIKYDKVGMARDPEGTAKKMTTLMSKLLTGSEAEKEEARRAISAMDTRGRGRLSREDIEEGKKKAAELESKYGQSDISRGWVSLENITSTLATSSNGGSLLELPVLTVAMTGLVGAGGMAAVTTLVTAITAFLAFLTALAALVPVIPVLIGIAPMLPILIPLATMR